MKIGIRYPLRFRARPVRCAGHRDVLCSFLHSADVPEVSSAETSQVFMAATTKPYRLIEFEGRLFRKVGRPGEEETDRAIGNAYQRESERNFPWFFTFEDGLRRPTPTAAKAISNIICHRLYLEGDGRKKEEEAWPHLPVIDATRLTRSQFRYEDIEPKLSDIDGDDFATGRAEHAAEASKLLVVDGDLWIETPPPAITVHLAGYGTSGRMVLELAHLPDWLDSNLDYQYFPLSAHREALAYAEMTTPLTATGTQPFEDHSEEAATQIEDTPLLSFDHEGYSSKRTTMILAGDVARWITKNPELHDKIGVSRANSVMLARDAAHEIGTDISAWPDVSDLVHDVTEAWKLTGRKPGWATIPQNRHAFGTMICERAVEMAPISLAPALSRGNRL